MLIVGTGGLAKDLVSCLDRDYRHETFHFFNDKHDLSFSHFMGKYPIIRSMEELSEYFLNHDNRFVCAIANPLLRYRMNSKIVKMGGVLTTLTNLHNTSKFATIESGCIIQPDIIISSDVYVGEGTFINCGTIIGHDVNIGKYCSFGPGVRVLGNVSIGDFSYIGCNTIITPGVKIGKKVRIGIGKIIDKDVPDNSKII